MNLKIVTVLILWILVINGQILNGNESHIERTECTKGTYGVNCEQKCPEGCDFNSCNIYTGVCDKGCSINYIPPDCKEKYPWLKSPPKLNSSDFNSIKLKIDLNSENIQGSSNVQSVYYQIAFKIASDESEFQYSEMKDIEELDSVIEITNLRPGMLYTFGAVIVSEDGNYNIKDIKTVDYYTKCLLPRNTDYDVKLLSGTDYINVTWNKLNYENEEVCKITEYLVKLMYYDTNLQKLNYLEEVKCNNNHGYIFKNLLAGEKYAVQVTAITATGQANLTNLLYIYTEPYRYIQIKNITSKFNKNSSLIITWDVDKMQAYSALNFELKYKIKRHFSCSNKVVINNWISMMVYNQTQKEISYLIPNTQYIIKVDPKIKGYTYNDNANSIFVKTPISKPNLTPVASENNSWYITNQSAYFSWKINKTECSKLNGLFRGYQIILKDLLEKTQEEKSIKENTVTFDELKPDTKYELQVYVRTNYGYNLEQGLLIPFKTKSKINNLGPVDELIVYKKDLKRKSIGLRWSFNDTDVIDGFIVIVIDENLNSTNQIIIEPERCVAWPTFYCITIDNLIPNDQYTVKIKAKSLVYPTGGSASSVVTNFNDGFADKPENLRTTNVGPTSISLEWDIPWIHNGVLKSFIVNIEEISSKDIDKCCESKPDVEIPITEELPSYNCTIDDLKPGSTYSIGVLSKTLSYYGLTSKIQVTTLPDSATIIRTIDHNQEVFEGENTNLRCVLPSSSEDELFNLVGSKAILTCNVDATAIRDRIKLTWLRCNQLSLSEEHDIIDNMLVLRNVQKSDQGLYNCIGIESDGTVVFSRSITLRVVEPPRIVLNPTRQVVKRGDNAQIICTADGDQPITITWSKLSSRSLLPPTVQTSGGYLRFNGITEQDAGRYLCKAANNIGETESVAEVLVTDNSRDRPAPIIRAIDHNQEVFEGGNTNLRCVLPRSSEQYTVKWSRSRSPLPYDSQLRGDVLSLRNLRLNDTDRYLCKVDSPYGSTTDYIDLRVLRRNSGLYIKPSQGTVYIGDVLELECIWTSDTSSSEYNEITWAKVNDDMENNVENQGSLIKFIDVKPENSGTYRCTKRDKNNNIITEDYELTVTIDNRLTAPTKQPSPPPPLPQPEIYIQITEPKIEIVEVGNTVTLHCAANSRRSQRINITWSKEDGYLPSERTQDNGSGYLYITGVEPSDSGVYVCTATDGYSSFSDKKILRIADKAVETSKPIQSQPEIYITVSDPSIEIVEIGSTVKFRCDGRSRHSRPVVLKWTREGGSLPVNRAIDNGSGYLLFTNLDTSDSGVYVCTASDGYSAISEKKTLAVVGGGKNVIKPTVEIRPKYLRLKVGEPAEFNCQSPGAPTLEWYRELDQQFNPSYWSADGVLRISAVKQSDQGTYYCRATNQNGETDSQRVTIYIEPSKNAINGSNDLLSLTIDPPQYSRPGDVVRQGSATRGRQSNF